jgi:hypothetical protein
MNTILASFIHLDIEASTIVDGNAAVPFIVVETAFLKKDQSGQGLAILALHHTRDSHARLGLERYQ